METDENATGAESKVHDHDDDDVADHSPQADHPALQPAHF